MTPFSKHYKTGLLFIAPQLLITIIFFIWPAFNAILQSLYYSDAFGLHHRFAALANFWDLFHRPEYGKAVLVTATLTLCITCITLGFGLLLAVLINSLRRGKAVYKTLLLWPYAVAPAVAAILWRFLCHPTLGWITQGLKYLGVDFNYLTNPVHALIVVIVTASWQQFSYNFLFYLAALSRVPKSILEAAVIDGATPQRCFWQIIFPLLSPTTFFLMIMNLIYAFFDTFGIIHVITNGGPQYSTTTLVYKVYEDGFVGMDPGSSAAQSVMLMIMVTVIMLVQFRFIEKKVHYT